MKAVELFCGIGGFRLGLDRLGVETVWANDLKPEACSVYRDRFPDGTLHEGSIREVPASAIPDHDILVGGFPCQSFSSAGKKAGTGCETNGTLFAEIVRILGDKRPKHFILENVANILSMDKGKHFRTVLGSLSDVGYSVEWRLIDSSGFGVAQRRLRTFIAGTLTEGGVVRDAVRLAEPGEIEGIEPETVRSRPCGGFPSWGIWHKNTEIAANLPEIPRGFGRTVSVGDVILPHNQVDSRFDMSESTPSRIAKSTRVDKLVNGVRILWNQNGGSRMGYTIFGVDGLSPTLTASGSRHYERYEVAPGVFRRLTDVDYARLMGFPDDWASAASLNHRYGLYGNAVVPACVTWVAGRLVGIDTE